MLTKENSSSRLLSLASHSTHLLDTIEGYPRKKDQPEVLVPNMQYYKYNVAVYLYM